ncbi:hypothetical protein [Neorhizobium sp. DT-125]|uniref:hypothetical protein n=1 Tax=Neorhizobium sp. DT-125 TaxID=3396163 RepID=UPI003F1D3432
MTSIITRAASAIAAAWRNHERKRMERQALLTIISRKNDHLRRDVCPATDDDLSPPQRRPRIKRDQAAGNCRQP